MTLAIFDVIEVIFIENHLRTYDKTILLLIAIYEATLD